jgi:hypothetical protein
MAAPIAIQTRTCFFIAFVLPCVVDGRTPVKTIKNGMMSRSRCHPETCAAVRPFLILFRIRNTVASFAPSGIPSRYTGAWMGTDDGPVIAPRQNVNKSDAPLTRRLSS